MTEVVSINSLVDSSNNCLRRELSYCPQLTPERVKKAIQLDVIFYKMRKGTINRKQRIIMRFAQIPPRGAKYIFEAARVSMFTKMK